MMRRFAFNLTALTALGLLLNQQHTARVSAPEKPRIPAPPLTIELRNVSAISGETSAISADFVMKNNSSQPLILAERWNSWGAYQWEYEITDATGKQFTAKNPQRSWTRNFPSCFKIEPGTEFQVPSFVEHMPINSPKKKDKNIFVSAEGRPGEWVYRATRDGFLRKVRRVSKEGWKYPVTIVGKFTAKRESLRNSLTKEVNPIGNWSGEITTAPITVEAPTTP